MKENIILTILIAMTLILTSCDGREPEALVNLDKIDYAFDIRAFEFQMVIDGELKTEVPNTALRSAHPTSPNFNPFYTDFILVHGQEEAQGFPDTTIVAWPREGRAQDIIGGIHWAVARDDTDLIIYGLFGEPRERSPISLEDFGLTYPLTVADLVDNWEKVNALWNAFTRNERSHIRYGFWGD